jgi:diacylglycerol kinase (ATP)
MIDSTDLSRREVIILANPVAGSQHRQARIDELIGALRARHLETILCVQREQLLDLVKTRGDGLRCVVAAGGDGTLNVVLNRAPGTPVAIFPLGTENLAARYFRVGRSPDRLADAIVNGAVRRLDLARIRGRFFSLMAGAGIDARVVHDVHAARQGHINHFTYLLPAFRAALSYSYPAIDILIEETGEQLQGAAVFLFNLPMYALDLPIASQARGDDGLLDLVVFERPGILNLMRYAGAILCRRHESCGDVQRRRVQRVHLSSAHEAPVQTDGDPAGHLPAVIDVVPGALNLLVGAGKDQDPFR